MKIKSYPLFLFALLTTISLTASRVSVQDAQNVALNFSWWNIPNSAGRYDVTATVAYTRSETDGTIDFYVFDINPVHAFVIVAADDIATPVLGYSTETYFNADFAKTCVQAWLDHAALNIYKAIQMKASPDLHLAGLWSDYRQGIRPSQQKTSQVNPLTSTFWNQYPYFNVLCPLQGPDSLCVTGCVATAMAQIMKYWNYPPHGYGSHSYTDDVTNGYSHNIGTLSADFATTNYDWQQMAAIVEIPDTAVALLMYQCGVSVDMDYGYGESSAYATTERYPCAFSAFTTNFGYDTATISELYENNAANWTSQLEAELNLSRPMLFASQYIHNYDDGHAWVCDGYDANDMFHMNWGWGGVDNGYFLTSNLSPYVDDSFGLDERVIMGIQPPGVTTGIATLSATNAGLKLFPNPNDGNATIQYRLDNAATPGNILITDLLGNRVVAIELPAGSSNQINLNQCDLSAGSYLCTLMQANKQIAVQKFVKF